MNDRQRQQARRKRSAYRHGGKVRYQHGGVVDPYTKRPVPRPPVPDIRTERPGIIDEDEPSPRTMSESPRGSIPNAYKGLLEPGEMPTPNQFKRKAVGKRSI